MADDIEVSVRAYAEQVERDCADIDSLDLVRRHMVAMWVTFVVHEVAREREACARECSAVADRHWNASSHRDHSLAATAAEACRERIRARGSR